MNYDSCNFANTYLKIKNSNVSEIWEIHTYIYVCVLSPRKLFNNKVLNVQDIQFKISTIQ